MVPSHNQLVAHHKAHAKNIRVLHHQDIHPAAVRRIVINGQADHHNHHHRHRIDRRRMCQVQVIDTLQVVAAVVAATIAVDHRIIHHRINPRVDIIREMTMMIGKKRLMHGKQHPVIGAKAFFFGNSISKFWTKKIKFFFGFCSIF